MTNKRKQKHSRKHRGTRTAGWGFGKRHRGKGNRGGHGDSGRGKRGAHMETYFYAKGIESLGKTGMRIKRDRVRERAINIRQIYEHLDRWLAEKLIAKEGDAFVVDLKKLGYDKLLGSGSSDRKIKIVSGKISEKAKRKLGI